MVKCKCTKEKKLAKVKLHQIIVNINTMIQEAKLRIKNAYHSECDIYIDDVEFDEIYCLSARIVKVITDLVMGLERVKSNKYVDLSSIEYTACDIFIHECVRELRELNKYVITLGPPCTC